jgi:sugar diacid utilization regulator
VLEEEKRIRDGRLIWIESTVSIAYDENGEAMGILGVSRDITARKRTEKLLSLAYERKRINHFFSDLLDGALPSGQDIYDRARRLRVNLPQSFAVCFCQVEDSRHSAGSEGEDMLLDEVVDRLNRQAGLVAWTFSGGIGVLCRLPLPYGGRQAERQAAEDCLKLLQGDFPGVRFSMGVGDYSASLTDFISRFRHAATAARIGRRHEDSCIRCYEDCGIDEIFDNFAGTREAEAFVRRVLGPLHDYDRDNGTELVETLIHILSRATLKEIAEAMFIHPKTIAARKQRIEQIVKLSLDSFEDRMTLGAALKIDKILQAGNGGRS